MNNNNPYNNANQKDLEEYYNYLLDLRNTIALELFYIKQVLEYREYLKNKEKEPEEYFKVRKRNKKDGSKV